VTQEVFINDLLEFSGMQDCKPCGTPVAPGTKLVRTPPGVVDEEARSFPYASVVGSLLWLARTSRPDILYATCQLAAHMANPSMAHVQATKRVLRYLKGTKGLPLVLHHRDELVLRAFADADYGGEPEESETPLRSLTGIVAYIVGIGPIFCQSSLQSTVARSTCEAEYVALGSAAQQCLGFRQLLDEIGFTQADPTVIYNDNAAAIYTTRSRIVGSKLRHIKINFHFIRDAVRNNFIDVQYCATEKMVADILTKALPAKRFLEIRDRLMNGLVDDKVL
jgi:hypothetical protein